MDERDTYRRVDRAGANLGVALHRRIRLNPTASVAIMSLVSEVLSTALTVEGAKGSFQSNTRTRH